ncbi:MAG: TIGR02147 family protein [Chitinispirillaceae bacterium]|nr:TIGR02147 family protein [Chitinispirillaceae bacterium]
MEIIFTYTDFRFYIRNWYEERRRSGAPITYRGMAKAVGLQSPAHITMILKGKTNLPQESIRHFIKLLKLKKKEGDYFTLLVRYNQAKGVKAKKLIYEKMIRFRECGTTLLHPDQYEYYQKWYYAVIHDILSFFPFRGNYRELAKMVEPSITAREAENSIRLLERLHFIERMEDGTYICRFPGISAYSEGRSVVLSSYAETMIERAKHALEKLPDEERVISWAGFSVSAETFRRMKEETRAFRKKLIEIARSDDSPERVFHLNLQIFPVSKRVDGHAPRKASE